MADLVKFGPFCLDLDRRLLLRESKSVPLGRRAYEILRMLALAKGGVVEKEAIMAEVWPGAAVGDNNLHVQISALRRALDPEGRGQEYIFSIPRRGYRLVDPARLSGPDTARQELLLPDKPSLAVLPFANLTGDPRRDYIVDGIAEELITALSRWHWFHVIARNSSFTYRGRPVDVREVGRELGVRYVVEGSVSASRQRMRIAAQLVEASAGRQVWAERFEFERADLFSVWEELSQKISAEIEPALAGHEIHRASYKRPEQLLAWDHYLRGLWHLNRQTAEDAEAALAHFRRAIEVDDNLVEAHVGIARAYHTEYGYGPTAHRSASNALAAEAARTALARDDGSCYAHYILALIAAHDGDLDSAVRSGRRAIELNANFALGYFAFAVGTLFRDGPDEALSAVEMALRLSPRDPQAFLWLALRGSALFLAGRYREAISAAEESRSLRWFYTAVRVLAASYARVGMPAQARETVAELLARETPERTIADVVNRFRRPVDRERYTEALRQAGLPDG